MTAARTVAALVDCYNDRRLQDVPSWYQPGATIHPAGWPRAVDALTWVAAFEMMLESFPDLSLQPLHVASGGEVAVLEARLTGTNTGPFYLGEVDRLVLRTDADRLPPTGRTMDITGTVVFEFVGEHATRERHYWPLVDTLVQLALVATRPTPVPVR